jgi:predicted oxidoreductase
MIGGFLVTVGGLLTDEYQNVLNQHKAPIPGLYASGNCCGRRFSLQYSTPIAGVSIGIALTLGREVGRIVAEL